MVDDGADLVMNRLMYTRGLACPSLWIGIHQGEGTTQENALLVTVFNQSNKLVLPELESAGLYRAGAPR